MAGTTVSDVLVVGAGLIGASIGLALSDQGRSVTLTDAQPGHTAQAAGRGAGRAWDGEERAAVVLLATPPARIAAELHGFQRRGIGAVYTHVSSVQVGVQRAVDALGGDTSAVCGGHPLAGTERSGPLAASGELFIGRPWALCPSAGTSEGALRDVRELALATGATPVVLTAEAHDRAVALVSHLPQVAASAVAAMLTGAGYVDRLAGPGLVDTTRIAASDPALWVEVLALNAAQVAPLVRDLATDLLGVAQALDALTSDSPPRPERVLQQASSTLLSLLQRGNDGRALVPVKRGAHQQDFDRVVVSVPDTPGQLAGLLAAASTSGVNVEDVRVEHVPGRPAGSIELLVATGTGDRLARVLDGQGWQVQRHG